MSKEEIKEEMIKLAVESYRKGGINALKSVREAIATATQDNIEDEISEMEAISYWGVIDLIDSAIEVIENIA